MRTQLLTKGLVGFTLFAALAVTGNAAAQPWPHTLDPRTCGGGTPTTCLNQSAQADLQRHHIRGDLTCRVLAGGLKARCVWRNGLGSGVAVVVFAGPPWKESVTVTQRWSCAERRTTGCR